MTDLPQCQADDQRLWPDPYELDEDDPEVKTWTEWGVIQPTDPFVRITFGSREADAKRWRRHNGGDLASRTVRVETTTHYSDWQVDA
jgi:hypothetical protein